MEHNLTKLLIDEQAKQQPKRRSRLRLVAVVLGIVALAGLAASMSRSREIEVSTAPPRESAGSLPIPVPQPNLLTASGYVVAQRSAAVSSKATGRIKQLFVKEGDTVKSGDVLAVLENDDLEQMVREATAQVAVAAAALQEKEATLNLAAKELTRISQLAAKRVVAAAELDSAEGAHQRAAASVAAARAQLQLSQAQAERARIDLEYTFIRTPFNGTVLTKNADVGEVVAPFGASADARAAVVLIADMDSLQIEADVSESSLAKIFVGQKCVIRLDSFPGKTYEGVVDSIIPTVDRAKATVLTKIRFLERDQRVIPQMSARVEFILSAET